MIVAADGAGLRLVTQPDHAVLAAEILRLWRSDGLPRHPRRDDLLFAVREHDNGWREADAAPRTDPATGRPLDFRSLPLPDRREVWDRGTARFAASRPYAALLIAEHARAVHRERRGSPEWDDLLDLLDRRRADLLESTGAPLSMISEDYKFLEIADGLSLFACGGTAGPLEVRGVRAALAGPELRLEPFPLAGTTVFRVPCRRLPDRAYAGDADLGGALAAARWEELEVRLAP